jgi:hypothetical protein
MAKVRNRSPKKGEFDPKNSEREERTAEAEPTEFAAILSNFASKDSLFSLCVLH